MAYASDLISEYELKSFSPRKRYDKVVDVVSAELKKADYYGRIKVNSSSDISRINAGEISDHGLGWACDLISSDLPALFKFYQWWVTAYPLIIPGQRHPIIRKVFLSLHNNHIHVSCNPGRDYLYGYEDYNGGPRSNPASYPIHNHYSSPLKAIDAKKRYMGSLADMTASALEDNGVKPSDLLPESPKVPWSILIAVSVLGLIAVLFSKGANNAYYSFWPQGCCSCRNVRSGQYHY